MELSKLERLLEKAKNMAEESYNNLFRKVKSMKSLSTRMKDYELKDYLVKGIPVIIRVDGKAFHTFCKQFEFPYSKPLNDALNETMLYVCKNTQNVQYAQRHSDEISFLLTDFDSFTTEAYFDYDKAKLNSIFAAMTAVSFFANIRSYQKNQILPIFDSRCFNIPEHDVANYFYHRHLDCKRNSISALAHSLYSHKELLNKDSSELQELIFKKEINWKDCSQGQKTGFHTYKKDGKWTLFDGHYGKEALFEVIEPILSRKHQN